MCEEPFKDKDRNLYQGSKEAGNAKTPSNRLNKKGRDSRNFRPSPGPKQPCFPRWLEKLDSGELDPLPSSKTDFVLRQIREWLKEAPKDKIIIFTQFRHFQTIIGCLLSKAKIGFVHFSVSDLNLKVSGLDLTITRGTCHRSGVGKLLKISRIKRILRLWLLV